MPLFLCLFCSSQLAPIKAKYYEEKLSPAPSGDIVEETRAPLYAALAVDEMNVSSAPWKMQDEEMSGGRRVPLKKVCK